MYRTPSTNRGRRSTRSSRGTSKRRRDGSTGSGNGRKRRFEEAAARPAKRWVRILRAPAPHIRFKVSTWVPLEELTEEERLDYDTKQKQQKQPQPVNDQEPAESQPDPTNNNLDNTTSSVDVDIAPTGEPDGLTNSKD